MAETPPRGPDGPRVHHGAHRWRSDMRRLIKDAAAPSHTVHLVPATDDASARNARLVVDLVLRICELAVVTGAPAADATGLGVLVADHYGVSIQVDITSISVTASRPGTADEDPVTAIRIVRMRAMDHQRLAQLEDLVAAIVHKGLDVDEARTRFAAIARSPRTYRPWVVTASMAMLGGGLAAFLGGGWTDVLVAMVVVALVDVLVAGLGRHHWPLFFVQAAGAALATTAAMLLMLGRDWIHAQPSVVAAAGLVSLLAGLGLVAASRDAVDGFYLTAAAGLFEVGVATGGIVVGTISVLWAGLRLGIPCHISATSPTAHPVVTVVAGAMIAVAIGISSHIAPRRLWPFALLGAIAWAGNTAGLALTGDPAAAAGLGAVLVGVAAQLGYRRWHVPVVALVMGGVTPLMPGLALYRGLFGIIQGGEAGDAVAAGRLMVAVAVGACIAIGSSLGTQLVRPLTGSLALPRRTYVGFGGPDPAAPRPRAVPPPSAD